MPRSDMAEPAVPSFVATCHKCDAEVWVSELTGRPLLDAGEQTICLPCFGKVDGPIHMEDAGQIAEYEAWVLQHEGPGAPRVPNDMELPEMFRDNGGLLRIAK
jgi:hypothetical protein